MSVKRDIFTASSARVYIATISEQVGAMSEVLEGVLKGGEDFEGFTETEIESVSKIVEHLGNASSIAYQTAILMGGRIESMIKGDDE